MDEIGFIEFLKRQTKTSKTLKEAIGEDCAVLYFGGRYCYLFTQDMLIEGIHFSRDARLKDVFIKAVCASLSDIASCGGVPLYLFLSLGVPKRYLRQLKPATGYVLKFIKKYSLKLAGGDTNTSGQLCIDAAILGRVEKSKLILRKGAREGDYIFVSGELGKGRFLGSRLGFPVRINEARKLVSRFKPSSMIDISDGLSLDLYRILEINQKGAVIFQNKIPLYKSRLQDALFWGEDYELLFTMRPFEAQRFLSSVFYKKSKFSHIGFITRSKGLYLEKDGRARIVPKKGYVHFRP